MSRRALVALAIAAVCGSAGCSSDGGSASAAPGGVLPPRPPAAPVKPVTETLFGTAITDPYRYMESMDADTQTYMKAQGAYTRAVLGAIAPRDAFETRVAEFGGSFGFVQGVERQGGRVFYEQRKPGSDNFDLVIRDAQGTRTLIDVAAYRATHGGKPYAINYFLASPDGTRVAAGVSEGGSEAASVTVYDAATGKTIAGPIDRAEFGAQTWSDDGQTLFFNRLKLLAKGDSDIEKYKDSTVQAWDLKSEPRAIVGRTVGHGPKLAPDDEPALATWPGAPMAALINFNGVQNEIEVWLAPKDRAATTATTWTRAIQRSDDVTGIEMRGNEIFLLSHHDAPTFKVLAMKAGEPVSTATTVIAASPSRVIESIHAAADALYVVAREGVYSKLLRVPAGSTTAEEVPLPFVGAASEAFTDPRAAGVVVGLESWTVPPTELAYDPATKQFQDLKLGMAPAYDAAEFVVQDLQSKAHDGVDVPFTVITPKSAKGPGILLIDAYGSYGISQLPGFGPRFIAFMREGAAYGVCHVRGGGELGDAWRLAGKDANKPNTWRDLIACAEDAIARGLTSKDKLFIIGGSAGGITMGRAMTERPDLFAGVIDQVPVANPLRQEFSPNGPPNIPEFGTVANEAGFKNLLAMDSYQAVKNGTTYPAVLITTGLNDPRVAPWEPAKLAARFQASGTPNPVLLRVEEEAGHGIGSTKTQRDQEFADTAAFIFWRAGRQGWAPAAATH